MENHTTQTTNVFIGQKRTNPKRKKGTPINRIITGVIIGLLVLWIWNYFNGATNSSSSPNSNQEQMQKDRETLEKQKG